MVWPHHRIQGIIRQGVVINLLDRDITHSMAVIHILHYVILIELVLLLTVDGPLRQIQHP